MVIIALTAPGPVRAAGGVGDPAPSFTLNSLDGTRISYRGAAGRPVMLVFWATWCPNCLKEIPVLKKIHERLRNRMDLYAINADINDSQAKAAAYQRKHELPYPVLYDKGSTVTRQYGVMGTPTVVIVDKAGIIRYRDAVAPNTEDIDVRLFGDQPWNMETPSSAGQRSKGFNHLTLEKSPYLQQHAHNPVWWYPWSDEALETARKRNKLIFLSIGYSTCHWCHVMENESFTNQEVADVLNRHFIAIKVDREERPDLDAIYMDAVQAMTGSGGWPLNTILTPDRNPFFGGTYFPKDRLLSVLSQIADAWKNQPGKIQEVAQNLGRYLKEQERESVSGDYTNAVFSTFFRGFKNGFDSDQGGRLGRPKFVPSYDLRVLLRIYRRTGSKDALKMARTTLDHVARGGIYDHVGGGFHRYSTDDRWLVPHFEKMLYDQAALANAYLEAFQVTHEPEYKTVAQETLDYVLRDLTSPEGAFYSAEDADSEGTEGKFYVWRLSELSKQLAPRELSELSRAYGVSSSGNFEGGANILNLQPGYSRFKRSKTLVSAMTKLRAVRAGRIRPSRDDKVLVSWNGLMISAMAKAGRVLDEPRYAEAAEKAASFILARCRDKSGRLSHRWIAGEAKYEPLDEDYSFFVDGLIELYQSTFNPRWLTEAKALQQTQDRLFFDQATGGYYLTTGADKHLLRRGKNFFDNVVPSGNSVTILNLLRLGDLLIERPLREKAAKLLKAYPKEAMTHPNAFPQMLIALDYALDRSKEIAVVGKVAATPVQRFLGALRADLNPNLVIAAGEPGDTQVPLLSKRPMRNNKPTFYVCRNHVCKLPTTDPENAKKSVQEYEAYEL